jgi:hypothetical protein
VPVILAAESIKRRIMGQGHTGQKQDPISKINMASRAGDIA